MKLFEVSLAILVYHLIPRGLPGFEFAFAFHIILIGKVIQHILATLAIP
jgi:hypothetical protein